MLLTDEEILKKLKTEYCRAIALERYSVGGDSVVKQKLSVLAEEIAKYEKRINEKSLAIRTFYL